MVTHLYSDFLHDAEQYALSEKYWLDLWQRIDPQYRSCFGWEQPWFSSGSPQIAQGNPIFSAVSRKMRLALRIIQYEPIAQGLEIQAWHDTFGGDLTDPTSIRELVSACALSDFAAKEAQRLIEPWVGGQPIIFRHDGEKLLLPDSAFRPIAA